MTKTFFVVTGIVTNKEDMLILKKSPDDYNYPNHWSFCSGFIKEFEAGEDTILREIKEETGLDAEIIKTGSIMKIYDKEKDINWVVLNFLCKVEKTDVKLDHENVDYRWVKKEQLKEYEFVPGRINNLKAIGFL